MTTKKFITKNGLRTQNIDFSSPDDSASLQVQFSNDSVLSVSGNSGQLFSITDSLSGTIFAVNDISGVPSIEVDDDGTIRFAEIFGRVLVGTNVDNGIDKLQSGGSSAFGTNATNYLQIAGGATTQGPTVQANGSDTNINLNLVPKGTGSVVVTGNISATTFIGNLTGNADTASSAPYSGLTGTVPTWNQNTTGSAGSVVNVLTFNNSGGGAASGTTFNGSAARTISYNTVGAAAASHNHTTLTGITSLGFATDASDNASISTTVGGTVTYFDFNLADDNNQEQWRWRFTPSGSTVYSAMTLAPSANGIANLVVTGSVSGTQIVSTAATGTSPISVSSTTAVTNLNADLLDGNHASAFYLATNPSGYTSNLGTVTSVSGTGTVSGLTLSGTVTTSGSLTLSGALSVLPSNFASQNANTILAAPNGSAGAPTFRTLVAADIPTLNQNTTGSAATLTTARTIAMTGDVSYTSAAFNGSANVSGTATLASVGTAGTYTKVTTDAKGRVTSGTTLTVADIPELTLEKLPTSAFKRSVRCATTANITLSGAQTIDGIAVVAGDRVLVKNQTTASQNGIYVVAAGAWTRAADANSVGDISSAVVNVENGTANGSELWTNTFRGTDVLGTTAMNWYEVLYNSGTWNINVSGNASTATNVAYSGLTGTVPTWNQNTTGSAASLTTARTISMTGDISYTSAGFNGSANVTGTATLASVGTAGTYTKVTTDAKGRVTGGASLAAADIPVLDASKITTGVLDAARLPSYVDDVLEYANQASFPATGETGKIYVAIDTNKTYRWSGSVYVFITSGAVDSVAGKTGVVTLVKADVGLGNVDNTTDSTKSVASAATLTTARTIGGVSFDGSANINLPGVNAVGNQNTTGTSAGVIRTVAGTTTAELVRGNMADNDQFRILVGGTASNAGYAEIATADDGTEPIYVRQYSGAFATLQRTAALLDGSGNTSFPGNITAANLSGTNTGDNPGVTSVSAVTPIVSSGGNTPSISHAASGATAGTYNSVTVNTFGHVTSGTNVAYLTSYTETDTLASVTSRGNIATNSIVIPAGDTNAYGFWGGSTTYSIAMGLNSSTYQYGPVTDYSIKMNMGAGAGRGFTWGQTGVKPIAALNSTTGNMQIAGTFSALSKSFLIPHPTKEGKQLRHGSLEGPENGVYIRGRLKDDNKIELPEYWTKLVDPESITVSLTAIGRTQNLYVRDVIDNVVYVGGDQINCFYTVFAERVDIDKLVVED